MSCIPWLRIAGLALVTAAVSGGALAQDSPPPSADALPPGEVTAAEVAAAEVGGDGRRPGGERLEDVPGRTVVVDSRDMVFDAREQLSLSDLDAETAETVRLINRAPGTYQTYFLSTWEFLPDRLFHPGFSIPLDRPKDVPEIPLSDALEPAPGPQVEPVPEPED